jgi:hypothetical protein
MEFGKAEHCSAGLGLGSFEAFGPFDDRTELAAPVLHVGSVLDDSAEGELVLEQTSASIDYLEECLARAGSIGTHPEGVPNPTRVCHLLPYVQYRCPSLLVRSRCHDVLPTPAIEDEWLLRGLGQWPSDFDELAKLTLQAIVLGVASLEDTTYYLELVVRFVDHMLLEHPMGIHPEGVSCRAPIVEDGRPKDGKMLYSVCVLRAEGLLRAVLVVLQRFMLYHPEADTLFGQILHIQTHSEGHKCGAKPHFMNCFRRLGQLFLVLHYAAHYQRLHLELHVHYTALLRLIAGVDTKQFKVLHKWLAVAAPLKYLMGMLQQCLWALHSSEAFLHEYREMQHNILMVLQGLSLHPLRLLQSGLQATAACQPAAGLDFVKLLMQSTACPPVSHLAGCVLRETLRDCPTDFEDSMYLHLEDFGRLLLYGDLGQSLWHGLSALSCSLESIWWLATSNPRRFSTDGKPICHCLLRCIIKHGKCDIEECFALASSPEDISTAKESSAIAKAYAPCAWAFGAFYLTALLHRCPQLKEWMLGILQESGTESMWKPMCTMMASHGWRVLMFHNMWRMLGHTPKECLVSLRDHYLSPLRKLHTSIRDLPPGSGFGDSGEGVGPNARFVGQDAVLRACPEGPSVNGGSTLHLSAIHMEREWSADDANGAGEGRQRRQWSEGHLG